jgi:CRISPR-associated protein Cas1
MTEIVYVTGEADIHRDESTIVLKTDSGKRRIPAEVVRHVVLLWDGTLTTKFIQLCGRDGIRISFIDYYGWYKGSFEPINAPASGQIKLLQAKHILDSQKRMPIAREMIRAAMDNSLANLRYHAYRGKEELKPIIDKILNNRERLSDCLTAEEIMGWEGLSRAEYLQSWGRIDERLNFGMRKKRPPNNPINCLISYLNGMTYSCVRHEMSKTFLDPTLSFLHAPSENRNSLSLDIAEPFKPLITDRLIWKMVRREELQSSWFDSSQEGICMLNRDGRRAVVERFTTHIDDGGHEMSLRTMIRRECMALQRHLLGVEEYIAFRRKA